MWKLKPKICYFILLVLLILNFEITSPASQGSQITQSNGVLEHSDGLLYGVCSHPWILTERDCKEIKELGAKYIRMDFVWQDFEPLRDAPFTFTRYDQFVKWAKSNDLEIIALLNEVPTWLIPDGGDKFTIPTGTAFDDFVTQFGEFVFAIVSHFKEKITYYEIWNEPNSRIFWKDIEGTLARETFNRGKAVEKYAKLLKVAYTQAKTANAKSKIISGGLNMNDWEYLQELYTAGAKGYFDYLGLHPYFWHSPTKNYDPDYVDWKSPYYDQFPKIKIIRNIMVKNEDGTKFIFITELGIGNSNGPMGSTTKEMKAERIARVFEKINNEPEYEFVKAVMWYQLRDNEKSGFGLLLDDFTPTDMYYAYKHLEK